MAKTLNEVLATARKSLPTADSTRELLVQTLEHLKDVKDTADVSASIYDIVLDSNGRPATNEDIEKFNKLKVNDIVSINASIFEDLNQCSFFGFVTERVTDYITILLFYNIDTENICGGAVRYVYEDNEWSADDAYVRPSPTKLYRHLFSFGTLEYDTSISQPLQVGQLEVISTVKDKINSFDAFKELLSNSISNTLKASIVSTSPHYFVFILTQLTQIVYRNNDTDGPYGGGRITITGVKNLSSANYTVSPL